MATKSQFLQIRVTPREKTQLVRRARASGQDVSTYVMTRVFPPAEATLLEIVRTLASQPDPAYALAELNDFLSRLTPLDFASAVRDLPLGDLSPFLQSYVAAMVDLAAHRIDCAPPAWTTEISGLDEPWFATPLPGLRLHLLRSAPIPFRRRNLFVDASVGARV
jgi:uncharacterized protein (DUF1778 family)